MTEYNYATFDENGRCLSIMSSPIEMDLPYPVTQGTKSEDVYLDGDEVYMRKRVIIDVDRDHFIADGTDGPIVTGMPPDAKLTVDNITTDIPGMIMIETAGEYQSNMIAIMFLPLDDMRAKYCADVDRAAGEARGAYLTTLPGQAAIYAEKEAEARAYLAAGDLDTMGPYLTAEPGDPIEAAQRIIARAEQCRAGLAAIEGLRMSAKQTIATATDVPTMIAALKGISL